MTRPAAACAGLALFALASAARADPPRAYRLDAAIDGPVIALGAAVSAAWLLSSELAAPYCAPVCDRDDVVVVDRWVAGRWDPTWSTISDVAELSVLFGSIATLLVVEGPVAGLNDVVVVGEAMLASTALAVIMQMSTRRPRPFVYGSAAPLAEREDGNAALSFFSGHTAVSVAAATSTAVTLARLGRRRAALGIGVVGLAGAALVGTGRMLGGNHFLTDVLAGGVVGAANGVLVPALHDAPMPDLSGSMVVLPLVGARGVEGAQISGALF